MAEIILLSIGIGLIIAEMFLGSFFLLFVGLGFVITALLEWVIGFENYGNVYVLWALSIGIFSALSLIVLRKPLKKRFGKTEGYDDDFLSHSEGVGVIKEGMVYFKGTLWGYELASESQSTHQATLSDGTQVRVVQIREGRAIITL